MKQTTSIEWLVDQVFCKHTCKWKDVIEQSKEMHKEQMLEFGSKVTERWGMSPVEPRFIEDEYNKYFKTNEQ